MSNYLPLVKRTYEFEGDKVAISFKRLTRGQMTVISPFIPEEKNAKKVSLDESMKLVNVTIDALKENIVSFGGLTNSGGEQIDHKEAIDQSYFSGLFSKIAMDLITESMVNEKK